MSTVLEATKIQPSTRGEDRVVLAGVGWALYRAIAASLGGRVSPRLTYLDGDLEIMGPSYRHEVLADRARLLVVELAKGLRLPFIAAGSTLWEREELDKGKQPDACFYIQNEPVVRGLDSIDLAIHPPPDLAIEIELTRRLLDGVLVYAALGIPEVWTFDGKNVRILLLDETGQYRGSSRSRAIRRIEAVDATGWLVRADEIGMLEWSDALAAWARDDLARRPEPEGA